MLPRVPRRVPVEGAGTTPVPAAAPPAAAAAAAAVLRIRFASSRATPVSLRVFNKVPRDVERPRVEPPRDEARPRVAAPALAGFAAAELDVAPTAATADVGAPPAAPPTVEAAVTVPPAAAERVEESAAAKPPARRNASTRGKLNLPPRSPPSPTRYSATAVECVRSGRRPQSVDDTRTWARCRTRLRAVYRRGRVHDEPLVSSMMTRGRVSPWAFQMVQANMRSTPGPFTVSLWRRPAVECRG